MVTSQGYYFTKGGSPDWGNCNAKANDQIQCEALVTFLPSELGKSGYVQFRVTTPSGIELYNSNTALATSGINTFVSGDIPLVAGNYILESIGFWWV